MLLEGGAARVPEDLSERPGAPLVVAVILSYNRRDDTLDCLRTLVRSTYPNLVLMVLDNGSTDGSKEAIALEFPDIPVVPLAKNRGYSGNNNVGIELSLRLGAEWILILNDDIVVAPDTLGCLVEAAQCRPDVGIIGPMVYHADEPNVIQSAGGEMDNYWRPKHVAQNEIDIGQCGDLRIVEWVTGCALMIRRETVEQIGMLDERFFCYLEEIDWCLRAREVGWQIALASRAKLWHKGVRRNYQPKPYVTYYSTRNRFLLLHKHSAPWATRVMAWFETLRTITIWTINPRWKCKQRHRQAMVYAMRDVLTGTWGECANLEL